MIKSFKTDYKINEDDVNGFHSANRVNGVDRAVTGGNDSPVPVTGVDLKSSAKQALDNLKGNNSTSVNDVVKTGGEGAVRGSSGVTDGLGFFATNWKTIAIVAGAATIIAAIAALIKKMNKTIKVRYNKCVKTLYNMQKDFTLKDNGLDMRAILPGVGSKIGDWIARVWGGNKKTDSNGNIGLHPFCKQYIEEISNDFRLAQDSFSKIKLAADNKKNNSEDYNESVSIRYNSFREAFCSDLIEEGVKIDTVNESVLLSLGATTLATLAVKGGSWVVSKMKDGKSVKGSERVVNVTKESTREICYAIINNYADKYVNMKSLFRELGIKTESLADLDKSSCEKLKTILEKYTKPEKNAYSKQYSRVKAAYDNMLKHYYAIGDGVIANFAKYTEIKDEKSSNLIVASKEKLQNMWDSQKNFYDNNFSHVLIEIISSGSYMNYLNFIIEKVIPVFESGLAGDADYILDVMPKSGEYYILRQTIDQAWLNVNEDNKGKTAIAKVISFDDKSKKIKFELVALVDSGYVIRDDGFAVLQDESKVNYDAYKDDDGKPKVIDDILYNKWMSLDPAITEWSTQKRTNLYRRAVGKKEHFIYAVGDKTKGDEYTKLVFAEVESGKVVKKIEINISYKCNKEEFEEFITSHNNDITKSMDFVSVDDKDVFAKIKRVDGSSESASNEDSVINILNVGIEEPKKEDKTESPLYIKRSKDNTGKDIKEFIFAESIEDVESVNHDGDIAINEVGDEDDKKDIVKPGSDDARNTNITSIVYCSMDDIESNNENINIRGSYISLSTPCNINEFKKTIESLGFIEFNGDAEKVKGVLKSNIKDSIKEPVKKNSITEISMAIKEILDKEGDNSVKITNSAKDVAKKIFDVTKTLDITNDFKLINNRNTNFECTNPKFKENLRIDTDVDLSDGKKLSLIIFPMIKRKNNNIPMNKDDLKNTAEIRIAIYKGTNVYQLAINDEKSITDKVYNIMIASIEEKELKDPEYDEIIKVERSEQKNNIDYKEIINTDASYLGDMIKIVEKDVDGSNGKKIKYYNVIAQYKEQVEITRGDNIHIVTFKNLPFGNDKFKFNITFDNSDNKTKISCANIKNGNIIIVEDGKLTESIIYLYEKSIQGQGGQEALKGKTVQQNQKESVEVKYEILSMVAEGYSMSISIKRSFGDRMSRGWYVISEGNFDDGKLKESVLDEPKFFSNLSHKEQINKYLKTTINSDMQVFEKYSNVVINSSRGYKPSGLTPLYESTILVKFDNEGNIIDKIQLPKQKIF